jgi:signal transduction histidine kinase/CheY-like chemotaxis protein
MLVILVLFFISTERQFTTAKWVEHTHEVIAKGHELTNLLVDMETGQRGFLITGNQLFLEPFHNAIKVWAAKVSDLKKLVADNPAQVTRIDNINALQQQWLAQAAMHEIAERDRVNNADIASMSVIIGLIEAQTGKKIIDRIRAVKIQFIEVEHRLMDERKIAATKAVNNTEFVVLAGGISAIILAILISLYISTHIIKNLQILVKSTEKISTGDFDSQIEIASVDEFSLLAKSFNSMALSLKESTDKMESAVKIKTDFLANMSHEIRTPMNGVLGMLTLLEDTKLDEEQTEYLESIRLCGDGLLVVINDILDISKLEAGRLQIELLPFDFRKTVNECCYLLDVQASNKGLNIRTRVDHDIPSTLIGDKLRIRQILLNIINNSIKFTEKGTIDLLIKVKSQEADNYVLSFTIVDQGIGISVEEQQKLFKPFSQVDNSITRKYGGTGLGLIICAQLIKQMKGKISVESKKGKGTKVTFTLPLIKSENTIIHRVNRFSTEEKLADKYPLKILLAEDNNINQAIAKKLFHKLGYEIDIAKDGVEAVKAVHEIAYDMIFMDMQMPNMDGVTATKIIIKEQPEEHPYIVAMTANVLPQDRQKCYDAGMVDFVGKPVNIDHIIRAIEQYGDNV